MGTVVAVVSVELLLVVDGSLILVVLDEESVGPSVPGAELQLSAQRKTEFTS